ncbi:MAG TPA: DUF4124 domain-containing protein [Gammaproteobacteria bacterium]
MVKYLQFILALLLAPGVPAWAGKLYKWTDADGIVHYSDKLPPDSVNKAHEEMNDRGLTTKSINREKTSAEQEQEAATQAAINAEKRRVAEAEAKAHARDEILLNTFTTERDLLLTRDDRLQSVDSIINLTISNNASLQKQITETRNRIEHLKKMGKEVPENLIKQLENQEGQLAKNEGFILIKREERVTLERQFEDDLRRYRELKGIQPEASAEQKSPPVQSQKVVTASNAPTQPSAPQSAEPDPNPNKPAPVPAAQP